jgi:hypothetical protein
MRRFTALGAVLVVLAAASTALGITFGQPDGNRHPYVGAMVVRLGDGSLIPICTGTMVSERVFLTAGHCTAALDPFFGPGNYDVGATFVSDLGLDDPIPGFDESDIVFGEAHTHPGFAGKVSASSKWIDVGVLVLDDDPGVGQATLPDEGMLNRIDLRRSWFTTVGYGVARDDKTKGFQLLFDDGMRRLSTQTATQANDSWLLLAMNPSTGNGGTCYGDSGGPHFLGAGTGETRIVASVTSWGDRYCRSTDWTARVDTQAVLSFVESFIDG